jgi:hypothetical protein
MSTKLAFQKVVNANLSTKERKFQEIEKEENFVTKILKLRKIPIPSLDYAVS